MQINNVRFCELSVADFRCSEGFCWCDDEQDNPSEPGSEVKLHHEFDM